MFRPRTLWRDAAIVVAATALMGLGALYLFFLWPLGAWQDRLRSLEGEPSAHVVNELGPPPHTILMEDDLDAAFVGYTPRPTHPVTNKVMVYDYLNVRGYLFLNRDAVVEHVAFAGT
jgi:hypothetical protein